MRTSTCPSWEPADPDRRDVPLAVASPKRRPKTERPCHTCGRSFLSRDARYCSLACRPNDVRARQKREERLARWNARLAEFAVARAARALEAQEARHRTCPECGTPFTARHGLQRFCCRQCKDRHNAPPHGPLSHECVRCHEAFESIAPNARYCSNSCRRALARKAPGEHARRRSAEKVRRMRPRILERFGMVCYLCTRPIPFDTTSMHPAALTLDHVVPIAQGGRDTEDNLRPAHRACNEDKGERYPTWWERRQAG
jgi:5-methylcytosine-specific restriction endonuclease McrA